MLPLIVAFRFAVVSDIVIVTTVGSNSSFTKISIDGTLSSTVKVEVKSSS